MYTDSAVDLLKHILISSVAFKETMSSMTTMHSTSFPNELQDFFIYWQTLLQSLEHGEWRRHVIFRG